MTKRYVTVSEIQDFLRCRWRWYAKWVLNRVPRKYSSALILGTAVHDVLEAHFNGDLLPDAFAEVSYNLSTRARSLTDPSEIVATTVAHKDLQKYRPQIVGWRDRFNVEETLEVEEVFEEFVSEKTDILHRKERWVLRGIPDRVVAVSGKVYHMQHKTAAINQPVDVLMKFFSRSLHETLYGAHLRDKYADREYAGSIINIIRKGVLKPGGNVDALNFQGAVALTDFDFTRARANLRAIVREMQRAEALGDVWAQIDNAQEDAGPNKNYLDGYRDVLAGKASLDDDTLFMNRESRYGSA